MAKSTFAPIRLSGPVTAADLNRVQDLIDASFKDLASKISTSASGIASLTSKDGSILLNPTSGSGPSVDLASADGSTGQVVVSANSTVSSLTVSGLDGDNDGDYEINGYFIQPGTGGGDWYVCLINGDSASKYPGNSPITTGIVIGNNSANVTVAFHGFISSRSGKERLAVAFSNRGVGGAAATAIQQCYVDTTTKITSLVFTDNAGANQIGAGSFVQVRKLKNKY